MSLLAQALAAADPRAPALDDGACTLDFGALRQAVEREREGLGPPSDARYALLADNGAGWVIADLALHPGACLNVPIPGSFTDAMVRHALDDAGVDVLLTDDDGVARALAIDWQHAGTTRASRLHRFRRREPRHARPAVPPGTRKVTYTSGSTARPKGVCLGGEALEAVAQSVTGATASLPIARHLCLLPLATLLENVAGVYAPLLRGATCVVPPERVTGVRYAGLDVPRLLETIASRAPGSLILVPELLHVLVSAAERGWRPPRSLQFVAVGGARVPASLLARAEAAGLPVFEGYGLSECASVVCLNTPAMRRAGTVGRPLPHARLHVDARGQVHVRGYTMLGYLGEAPRDPEAALATGDLGRLDHEGCLQLDGRIGHRFITSLGRNVAPEWIESEVSARLGGRPVMAFGEARPWVAVLVGASAADAPDAAVDAAIAAANADLPDFARVRHWARAEAPFCAADGTLTANGRLRRAQVEARHGARIAALYTEALAS